MDRKAQEAVLKFNLKEWVERFLKAPREAMSQEISRYFFALSMAEHENRPTPAAVREQFLFQVIEQRCGMLGLDINDPTKCFLMLMTGSPGTAVMYLIALRYLQSLGSTINGQVNMTQLAHTFHNGFLTPAAVSELWDAQKVYGMNMGSNALDSLGRIENGESANLKAIHEAARLAIERDDQEWPAAEQVQTEQTPVEEEPQPVDQEPAEEAPE